MSEWKRIFLNRIWLGTAALSLLFSLVIYATAQSSRVGSSVLAYREHTNQWTQILSVVSPEDGLALLERENQTLQGWNTARMLVQLEEWQGQIDEEILNRYREQYENLDEMLHAVRSETAPELDIAVQESVARWIDRIVYQMGYAEFWCSRCRRRLPPSDAAQCSLIPTPLYTATQIGRKQTIYQRQKYI